MQNVFTHAVTLETFEKVVDENPMVILDFWASWCAPCKIFSPLFEKMAELNPDIYFGTVDTETAKELAQAFQIRSIPTLMAFKKAELVFEQPGLLPAEAFQLLMSRLRASNEKAPE